MSGQKAEVHWARYLDGNRRVVLEADHARIVAEATAEARAAERRHWEARFRNAEQAHAAALAEERQRVLSMRFTEFMAAIKKSCPCICHEYTRDINPHDGKCVCNGGDGMETLGVAAPRTLTADDNCMRGLNDARKIAHEYGADFTVAAIDAIVHDGEAAPQDEPSGGKHAEERRQGIERGGAA